MLFLWPRASTNIGFALGEPCAPIEKAWLLAADDRDAEEECRPSVVLGVESCSCDPLRIEVCGRLLVELEFVEEGRPWSPVKTANAFWARISTLFRISLSKP